MDALKLIREKNRMCKFFGNGVGCWKCPAYRNNGCIAVLWKEEIVSIVENWSKEHPHKTRQSLFLERYPGANIDDDGVLKACPAFISASYRDKDGKCTCTSTHRQCSDCRKNFWNQEIEDM